MKAANPHSRVPLTPRVSLLERSVWIRGPGAPASPFILLWMSIATKLWSDRQQETSSLTATYLTSPHGHFLSYRVAYCFRWVPRHVSSTYTRFIPHNLTPVSRHLRYLQNLLYPVSYSIVCNSTRHAALPLLATFSRHGGLRRGPLLD